MRASSFLAAFLLDRDRRGGARLWSVFGRSSQGPEIPDGPHRKNILNCAYTEVGIGLAYRDDGVPYWVLDLANRKL
jgi:hypothetical protein